MMLCRRLGSGFVCVLAVLAGVASARAGESDSGKDSEALRVVPRTQDLKLYPCQNCHDRFPTNPTPRSVTAHPQPFNHGGGIWCLDCHSADQRDHLVRGRDLYTFDEAPEVCAVCHIEKYRDWQGGSHGKRVGNWQGERTVYSCVHCHDPHDPSIKPRRPSPPPSVRRGLDSLGTSAPEAFRPSWRSAEVPREHP